MKTPKGFPEVLPPGTRAVGINLPGIAPAAVQGRSRPRGKAAKGQPTPIVLRWPLLALDVSSSATGWARQDGPGLPPSFGLIRPPSSRSAVARIDWTVEKLAEVVALRRPGLVVLEWSSGRTHGSIAKASGLSVLGASQGAVRQACLGVGLNVETVTETEWTCQVPKAKRAAKIRLIHPAYAKWAGEKGDSGLDCADALGILEWVLRTSIANLE